VVTVLAFGAVRKVKPELATELLAVGSLNWKSLLE
jgi:hypothetical protein